jgi:hypothetical protein
MKQVEDPEFVGIFKMFTDDNYKEIKFSIPKMSFGMQECKV